MREEVVNGIEKQTEKKKQMRENRIGGSGDWWRGMWVVLEGEQRI